MAPSTSTTKEKDKPGFRDRISTVDSEGKRVWVYPKKPKGKLTSYRHAVAIFIYSLFFLLPYLKVNGEPLFLLNIFERKFILFGVIFWPQDFHLLVLSLITFIVFIVLFTVIYGRLFCGWACPQTVFMEFIYRRIEYLIEGDAPAQKRLNKQAWNGSKIFKKTLKHFLFILVSLAIGTTAFHYIVGAERMFDIYQSGFAYDTKLLVASILFSGAVYFVFAFFREQVCIIVCPYGRLQGVLLDKQSIVVAYDYLRGEPRGAAKSGEDRKIAEKGDCVDCHACVQVCPTNIDIRNGTQLECINCTACIDACDTVMEKHQLPKGLIRYDSESGISSGIRKIMNPRTIAYTAVLGILMVIVSSMFLFRGEVETTILRQRGTLYQEYGESAYSNVYEIDVVNRFNEDIQLNLKLEEPAGEIQLIATDLLIPGGERLKGRFFVIIDKANLTQSKNRIKVGIYNQDKLIRKYPVTFVGPNKLDEKN